MGVTMNLTRASEAAFRARHVRTAGSTALLAARIHATVVANRTPVLIDGETSSRKSGTASKTVKDNAMLTKSHRGQTLMVSAALTYAPAALAGSTATSAFQPFARRRLSDRFAFASD